MSGSGMPTCQHKTDSSGCTGRCWGMLPHARPAPIFAVSCGPRRQPQPLPILPGRLSSLVIRFDFCEHSRRSAVCGVDNQAKDRCSRREQRSGDYSDA
eukprot:2343387-Rhodomonas_salina.2